MNSRAYIVRVWFEQSSGGEVWRATVLHASTQERWFFSSPASLSAFLSERAPEVFDPQPFRLEHPKEP